MRHVYENFSGKRGWVCLPRRMFSTNEEKIVYIYDRANGEWIYRELTSKSFDDILRFSRSDTPLINEQNSLRMHSVIHCQYWQRCEYRCKIHHSKLLRARESIWCHRFCLVTSCYCGSRGKGICSRKMARETCGDMFWCTQELTKII